VLLVVRELLLGPERYLRAGSLGVSPNVLAQRLRELEGEVRRRKLAHRRLLGSTS
jgi:DNA-binding HxlR family transcriptional regulator